MCRSLTPIVLLALLSACVAPALAETRICLNGVREFQPQQEYKTPAWAVMHPRGSRPWSRNDA